MERVTHAYKVRLRVSSAEGANRLASLLAGVGVALSIACVWHPWSVLGAAIGTCSVEPCEYDVADSLPSCVGDCNGDGGVTIDELITMVNITLGGAEVTACAVGDANHDEQITVDEIITAVNGVLRGCSVSPTATATPQPTPTPTPTPNCEITVSGEVYDSTVGPTHGISGARVSVQLSAPRSFEAITGADGRYTLSVPSPYGCLVQRLDVAASGYTSVFFPVTTEDLLAHPVRNFALGPVPSAAPIVGPRQPGRLVCSGGSPW